MKAILRSGFLALAIMALAVPASAGPYEDGQATRALGDCLLENAEYTTADKMDGRVQPRLTFSKNNSVFYGVTGTMTTKAEVAMPMSWACVRSVSTPTRLLYRFTKPWA